MRQGMLCLQLFCEKIGRLYCGNRRFLEIVDIPGHNVVQIAFSGTLDLQPVFKIIRIRVLDYCNKIIRLFRDYCKELAEHLDQFKSLGNGQIFSEDIVDVTKRMGRDESLILLLDATSDDFLGIGGKRLAALHHIEYDV